MGNDAAHCETVLRDAMRGLPKEQQRQVAKRLLVRLDNEAQLSTVQVSIIGRYTEDEAAEANAQFAADGPGTHSVNPAALSWLRVQSEPPKYKRPLYGSLSERGRAEVDRLEHYMRTQVVVGDGDPVETYLRTGAVWFETGFRERDDFDAFATAAAALENVNAGPANEMLHAGDNVDPHRFMFFGRWFASGAPRVRLSAAQAAALMLTDLPKDFVDSELRQPWPAFVVELPEGLVPIGDAANFARRVLVHRVRTAGSDCLWWVSVEGTSTALCVGRRSLYDMQSEDELYGAGQDGDRNISFLGLRFHTHREVFARFAAVAKLVAGICYKMQETPPPPVRAHGGGAVRRRPGGPPQTTDVTLGFPVKVDFSNLVRGHLLGQIKRLAKVQWLVRGHWRNQACGAGRLERRRQWIEPFWKGPIDAPILVRPFLLPTAPAA